MELNVKDFATREDLENTVQSTEGLTAITGTIEELARLNLDHTSNIHGIHCVASDYTAPSPVDKPNRGEIFESSLDGAPLKKSKKTK